MDERELGDLFREVPGPAPPASFDTDDVRRGSRRVTARRRTAAAGGAFVAAGVLVGGVGLGTGLFGGSSGGAGEPVALPPPSPTTSAPEFRQGPMSLPGGDGCPAPDRRLAEAVVEQVPAASNTAPIEVTECPEGARGAAFVLGQGRLSVTVAPAQAVSEEFGATDRPDGSVKIVQPTESGKVLTVVSSPQGGAASPEAERLPEVAEALAARF